MKPTAKPSAKPSRPAARADESTEARLLAELAGSIGGVSTLGRLAALGQLNGGVLHDLNNLLAVTLGYANLLMAADLEPDSESWRRAREIRNAAVRAQALIGDLLYGAEPTGEATATTDPAAVLEGIHGLLDQAAGPEVELRIEIGSGTPPIGLDAGDLERAMINLVLNAREAMPDGGTLTISGRGLLFEKQDLAGYREPQRGSLRPGPYTLLTVGDNGCGMDRKTRDRVLQPYFSTKHEDPGKGLGLATVAQIVDQAGGAMSISSTLGRGTIVYLWLSTAE